MLILLLLFWLCIIAMPIFWVVHLYRYLSARRQNKLVGGEYWKRELSNRKRMLIVGSILLVVFAGVLFGLMAIVANSIAYM